MDLTKSIVTKYAQNNASLKDFRFAAMCVLSFIGLFHTNELLNIRLRNNTVLPDYISIRLPESKTNAYRKGQDVFQLLLRYLVSANIPLSPS